MRILMWVSFYWPDIGGVETFTRQLAHALKSRGHTVCVVAAHGRSRMPDVSDDDGIAVHRFPFWEAVEKRDPMLMLSVQKRLGALKREFAADLVHVNCLDASIFFQLRSIDIAPAPMVVTLHWTPPLDLWGETTIVGKLLRSSAWIAAISTHQLALMDAALPECNARTSLFLNGLEAPLLAPMPVPDNCQEIFCIGRHVRDKGFDLAIEAFARIAPDFPGARMVIAGDGVERSALLSQAAALGLSERITFPGWISHEDVPAAITRSAMVVMTSRFEPFGLIAVEAAHMQRPIIATNVGGLPDIVVDEETGILVADQDVDALSRAMARLLQEPHTISRMGVAARQHVLARFAADRNTTMYESLFQRLTGEGADVVAG